MKAIQIAASWTHCAALLENGRVMAAGDNEYHECDVKNWQGIRAIACGGYVTLGLKDDGSVICIGGDDDPATREMTDLADDMPWSDIRQIFCGQSTDGDGGLVGLREDGTVVTADGDEERYDVGSWTDIEYVCCDKFHTVGLRKDGTLLVAGSGGYSQEDVESWTDIVSVSCYGFMGHEQNENGKFNWNAPEIPRGVIVAVDKNGHLKAAGNPDSYSVVDEHTVRSWNKQEFVWSGIRKISCERSYLAALLEDGTVVTTADEDETKAAGDWTGVAQLCCSIDYCMSLDNDGKISFSARGGSDQCELKQWVEAGVYREDYVRGLEEKLDALQAELSGLKGFFVKKKREQLTEEIGKLSNLIRSYRGY